MEVPPLAVQKLQSPSQRWFRQLVLWSSCLFFAVVLVVGCRGDYCWRKMIKGRSHTVSSAEELPFLRERGIYRENRNGRAVAANIVEKKSAYSFFGGRLLCGGTNWPYPTLDGELKILDFTQTVTVKDYQDAMDHHSTCVIWGIFSSLEKVWWRNTIEGRELQCNTYHLEPLHGHWLGSMKERNNRMVGRRRKLMRSQLLKILLKLSVDNATVINMNLKYYNPTCVKLQKDKTPLKTRR